MFTSSYSLAQREKEITQICRCIPYKVKVKKARLAGKAINKSKRRNNSRQKSKDASLQFPNHHSKLITICIINDKTITFLHTLQLNTLIQS